MAMKDIPDKMVLLAYKMFEEDRMNGKFPYDYLMEISNQPFKVCYKCMERASDRDLIDYGVSLRTGWITEKGQELLHGNVQ
jgi:hypothetical protein